MCHKIVKEVKKNLCEFGIEPEECYFCGQPNTIGFQEHYTFCPNCAAIYTFSIIQESYCDHIDPDKNIPCVDRIPCYKSDRDKVHIVEDDNGDQRCSICDSICIADGW